MPPRHDSASEITLPRATSLLGAMPATLSDDALGDEITIKRRVDEKPARWHVELELDRDQVARLHRLGFAESAVVWRDGFSGWKPLLEASEIREAIDALKTRAPSSMKSALRRATIDRITSMSRPAPAKAPAVSPRRRMNTDPALRLYASLNRRRAPQDAIELAPAPKITVAAVEPAPLPLPPPRDSVPPISAPVVRPRAPRVVTVVTHTAVAAITAALTALVLWAPRPPHSPPASSAAAAAPRPAKSAIFSVEREPKPGPPAEAPISVQSLAVEPATRAAAAEAPPARPRAEPRETALKTTPVERAPAPNSDASSGPDRAKMARALAAAAAAASDCGVGGSARVVVTFGPSGVVRRAAFEGRLPELTDGSCVLRAVSRARIPPFSGDAITVRKTVSF